MSYIYEYAGSEVNECASVIAQSIEMSDDKCVLGLTVTCLFKIVQISNSQDTQTKLSYGMKFRLLKAIFNSLDRYSAKEQMESVCYLAMSILQTLTPEERRDSDCHHFIQQILQHASALMSSSIDHYFAYSIWNCLKKLTEIGQDECREFVRSSGPLLFQKCFQMFPSEDQLLLHMTGKKNTLPILSHSSLTSVGRFMEGATIQGGRFSPI